MIPPQIQALLIRKRKADDLPAEIRSKYIEEYNSILAELVQYALVYPLQLWDEEINSFIVRWIFQTMAEQYERTKPYIEWMCQSLIPEVDESFRVRDPERFYKCVQMARQQLSKV